MWEISAWPTESNNVSPEDELVDLDKLVDDIVRCQQDNEE